MEQEILKRLEGIEAALTLMRFPLPPPLLKVSQAAKVLGVSEDTVRRLIAFNSLPAVRIPLGERVAYRIDQKDLTAFVEARKNPLKIKGAKSSKILQIPDMGI